jgi:hypothetical protein
MSPFVAGFSDELVKLAMGGVAQVNSNLAEPQLTEDRASEKIPMNRIAPAFFQTNPNMPGKIREGTLGPQGNGPLLADPSRWPTNRLTG